MWDYIKMWNFWGRVGMIGGMIGFLVGAVAAIIADPVVGTFIFVTAGAICFFVFRSVLGPEVEARKLMETGETAEATILKVTETGWTVNNMYYIVKFEVEVRPKDRPAYRAEIKSMISRLTMAQFQPGAVVPVKFDPKDPKKVALVETTEAGSTATASAGINDAQTKEVEAMIVKRDALNKELMSKGELAEATILRSWELGIIVDGDNPVMGFMIEVRPAGKPVFTAETQAPVIKASTYKYQPGKKVYVKFDPNDTTRVTLDHAAE